jgi:hypothetical protein
MSYGIDSDRFTYMLGSFPIINIHLPERNKENWKLGHEIFELHLVDA